MNSSLFKTSYNWKKSRFEKSTCPLHTPALQFFKVLLLSLRNLLRQISHEPKRPHQAHSLRLRLNSRHTGIDCRSWIFPRKYCCVKVALCGYIFKCICASVTVVLMIPQYTRCYADDSIRPLYTISRFHDFITKTIMKLLCSCDSYSSMLANIIKQILYNCETIV